MRALVKGRILRGAAVDNGLDYAELLEEPPRPGPRPSRQVVAQPHELERRCISCRLFHGDPPGGTVVDAVRS